MESINILIDMPVHGASLKKLETIPGVNIKLVGSPEERVRSLDKELIAGADVLFCTFPPENHAEMEQLKFIQIASAGYKQLIGIGLNERNIKASNALGVFDVPIAEWNVAMMVNLARDMRGMMHNQDNAVWDRPARFQREIRGSVVGIWGYGGIGRETARLAKALGMTVHVLSRGGVKPRTDIYSVEGTGDPEGVLPDKVFLMDEKETFLKGLDFLIIAMPQTDTNQGIIGESELKLLKPTTYLLNPARGPLIDEQALIKALKNNWIAGAALDTHYYYPTPPEHPLWGMPNVIFTPHISGSSLSPKFLERVWDIFIQNVQRLTGGQPLLNQLAPADLK
ncbi:D-2-hydroxyacid dehydrogenase [Mucilaginibacter mali]|uniref:D-2-hydroxyacid dehydrogenase n=1 Tax=Mucilaginibacter mali TaxID=2740462 RepID=A0A7D4Q408_9SPHI|nr:D-2-hydroxyacid dehydrogenase [Mucilaginibacter mali]QKJ32626.1 D-2-hydroxyacid dehydrogenase [Mucilaginibacter mali]